MAYKKKIHEFEIGQKIELTRNVESPVGFFEKGDILTICDLGSRGVWVQGRERE